MAGTKIHSDKGLLFTPGKKMFINEILICSFLNGPVSGGDSLQLEVWKGKAAQLGCVDKSWAG